MAKQVTTYKSVSTTTSRGPEGNSTSRTVSTSRDERPVRRVSDGDEDDGVQSSNPSDAPTSAPNLSSDKTQIIPSNDPRLHGY